MMRDALQAQATAVGSRNPQRGFYGAMGGDAAAAWPLAVAANSRATGECPEDAGWFLDSRWGRHFADEVQMAQARGLPLADAIDAATRQWMGWTIGRQTSRHYGIPVGLPFLIGMVIHCEIIEESLTA